MYCLKSFSELSFSCFTAFLKLDNDYQKASNERTEEIIENSNSQDGYTL